MSLRKFFLAMGVFLLVVTFSSFGLACDDEKRMEISVQAPIETVDCTNTPATIGVLGHTIDISNASFSPRRHGAGPSCADLAVGQTVEVALTSDVTPIQRGGSLRQRLRSGETKITASKSMPPSRPLIRAARPSPY